MTADVLKCVPCSIVPCCGLHAASFFFSFSFLWVGEFTVPAADAFNPTVHLHMYLEHVWTQTEELANFSGLVVD